MIEFLSIYLTMLSIAVGVILVGAAVTAGLMDLYRVLEPKIPEDWAIGVKVTIVFLIVVLLFSLAYFFGGGAQ